jgi:hypothetical protein
VLDGAAATSAGNAWAVGFFTSGSGHASLIEHWDGHAWARVPSPSPGGPGSFNDLAAVAAGSASNAWAAGTVSDGARDQAFAIRCC